MKKFSIKVKLSILCSILMGALLVVGLVGLNSIENVIHRLADLGEVQLPAVRNMTLTDMMHDGLRAVAFKALLISGTQDAEKKKEVAEELDEMTQNLKKYAGIILELNVREKTKKAIADSLPEIDAYAKVAKEIVDLSLAGNKDLAVSKLDKFEKAFTDLEVKLESLGELIEKDADESREAAKDIASASKHTSIILILLGMAVGIISSAGFTIGLSKSLNHIAGQLSESASQVTSASGQIAVASKNLFDSSNEQSTSLEKTASALEQITAMISKASEGADTTSESSSESQKIAEAGRSAVDQMLSSMDEISQSNDAIMDQIKSSNKQMSEVVNVIQEIGNKTNVINEIVFQTKLLSFNASVEAARAGEHGKGFAVVAEEVGNLAQMSGNAAKEITDMLGASTSKVEIIVKETKNKVEGLAAKGRTKVESGMEVARQCADLLNEIVQNVNRVSGLSRDISVATKEQSQGVSEINKAMGQLDSLTQKNSSGSQETASAATQLSDQANKLQNVVAELLIIVEGSPSSNPPTEEKSEKAGFDRGGIKNLLYKKSS